jgi:hypothetical protein
MKDVVQPDGLEELLEILVDPIDLDLPAEARLAPEEEDQSSDGCAADPRNIRQVEGRDLTLTLGQIGQAVENSGAEALCRPGTFRWTWSRGGTARHFDCAEIHHRSGFEIFIGSGFLA